MKESRDHGPCRLKPAGEFAVFAVSVIVLVALMFAAWQYVLPDGRTISLFEFVALFLREILMLGLFATLGVFVFVAGTLRGLARLLRRIRDEVPGSAKNRPHRRTRSR